MIETDDMVIFYTNYLSNFHKCNISIVIGLIVVDDLHCLIV